MRTGSVLACSMLLAVALQADAGGPPEEFRGTIAVTAGVRSGQRVEIVMHVERYIGDDAIDRLARVLVTQGENALLHEISALPAVGWIEIDGTRRTELKGVRSLGGGGLRQLRFLTMPPIRYDDLWMMTRSPDYNYGFVELVVDENGEGEGTVIPAAAIEISDGRIRVAGLGSYAFRILDVGPQPVEDDVAKPEE